ncbi:kinase catalytic domain protein [Fusarium tjaetaba]|uniref:Kinase catalytic domain protein n=1 Tax=Fusarium tjaetaba TaxID=1567544 RepID=A0A8H5RVM2_9HYPO|nr:kinase catalytic domain protein [Fusarium tjaetaba]KAF5638976.1 kinase catalytic domain protein [Fusarium tjaetaba]
MAEAVLGVLGLVGTAIDVLKLGYIASDRKDSITILRGQLHLESVLLRRWAECVLIGPPGEVPVIPTEYCAIVHERLTTMLALFRNSGHLIEKHSRDMQPLFPPTQAAEPSLPGRHTTLSNYMSKVGARSSPFKWAVRDAEVLRQLLGDIQTIRVGLEELLPPDKQLMSLQILTDIMPSTSTESIPSIDTAARIASENNKVDALALETLRATLSVRALSPDTVPTLEEVNVRMRQLFIMNYSVNTADGILPWKMDRCSVLMSSNKFCSSPRPVIIEWRQFNPELYTDFRFFEADVVKLCWLLSSLRSHPDVHLPRCLGYFKDTKSSLRRFGIVLEYSQTIQASPLKIQPSLESLYDALKNGSYRLPAIEIRLSLAQNIAASVFQLLSAGWLHKSLRSDNIVLTNGLKVVQSAKPTEDLGAVDFIIAGFEFARLDKPGQISDGDNRPSKEDLYRHPNATSEKRARLEYQQKGYIKSYDVYSLGVLLSELGFWRRIDELQVSQTAREEWQHEPFPHYLRDRVSRDMPGMMGSRFTRVVLWCLATSQGETVLSTDQELLAQFEGQVLIPLFQCRRAATFLV